MYTQHSISGDLKGSVGLLKPFITPYYQVLLLGCREGTRPLGVFLLSKEFSHWKEVRGGHGEAAADPWVALRGAWPVAGLP